MAAVPPGVGGYVSALASVPHSDVAYAVVSHAEHARATHNWALLERSRGSWHRISGPDPGGLGEAAINAAASGSAKSVWLAGIGEYAKRQFGPMIWRRRGGKFVTEELPGVDTDSDAGINSLSASSANNAWAGGQITVNGEADFVLHWNGRVWAPLSLTGQFAAKSPDIVSISTSSWRNTWVVDADHQSSSKLLHWDGHVWTQAKGLRASRLTAVATTRKGIAYAVGGISRSVGHRESYIARYDGHAWHRMALPAVARHLGLDAVVARGSQAWALGTTAPTYPVSGNTYILHTDGKRWSVVRSLPVTHYFLGGLSAAPGNATFAGGDYGTPETVTPEIPQRTYLLKINGTHAVPEAARY